LFWLQAAPTPWTRYFFPQMVGSEDNGASNPFFQYFDVILDRELWLTEEQLPTTAPTWAPAAFKRLSYVQMSCNSIQPKGSSRDVTQGAPPNAKAEAKVAE
jgi:hypothetical protein